MFYFSVDHTRVILKTCDKGAGSDYINANHILPEDIKAVTSSTSSGKSGTTEGGGGNLDLLSNLSKKSKRYIATQVGFLMIRFNLRRPSSNDILRQTLQGQTLLTPFSDTVLRLFHVVVSVLLSMVALSTIF